jgi:hypothetical protein
VLRNGRFSAKLSIYSSDTVLHLKDAESGKVPTTTKRGISRCEFLAAVPYNLLECDTVKRGKTCGFVEGNL